MQSAPELRFSGPELGTSANVTRYMYTGIAVVSGSTSVLFYWIFHQYDREEAEMNELGAREDPYAGKGSDESDAGSQNGAPAQQAEEKL